MSGPLAQALAAEHAAIWAYGRIGVRLSGDAVDLAREVEAAHRRRRDRLVLLLTERGETELPAAAPAYELPFPVTGEQDALHLAVLVEERTAAVWRAGLRETVDHDRELVLQALVETAVAATRWRVLAGVTPPVVPFPGEY